MVLQNSKSNKHVSCPEHINGLVFIRGTDCVLCGVGAEAACVFTRISVLILQNTQS